MSETTTEKITPSVPAGFVKAMSATTRTVHWAREENDTVRQACAQPTKSQRQMTILADQNAMVVTCQKCVKLWGPGEVEPEAEQTDVAAEFERITASEASDITKLADATMANLPGVESITFVDTGVPERAFAIGTSDAEAAAAAVDKIATEKATSTKPETAKQRKARERAERLTQKLAERGAAQSARSDLVETRKAAKAAEKAEPKVETPAEAETAKRPRSGASISLDEYKASHGQPPRGKGRWIFKHEDGMTYTVDNKICRDARVDLREAVKANRVPAGKWVLQP